MTTEETLPAAPQEQFVSAQQQRVAVTLGMWIFLATEVLFFGGLLVIYSAYRTWYPHDFATGSRHLDILLGTFNPAVLLTSSFLMAGAVTASRLQDRRTAFLLLLLTAGCGTTFVAIKGYEWHTAISDGFWPVSLAQPHGVDLFYSLYFVMTGLHGLHLLIGISLILATAFRSRRDASFAPNQNQITLLGLYWHFVDVVWIFLFPLLYFIGRSS
jgi:cytochrome c oxidase subunit III